MTITPRLKLAVAALTAGSLVLPVHAAGASPRRHHHHRHPATLAQHATQRAKVHRRLTQRPPAGPHPTAAPLAVLAPAHGRRSHRQLPAGHSESSHRQLPAGHSESSHRQLPAGHSESSQRQRSTGHAGQSRTKRTKRTKPSNALVARRTAHAAGDPTDTISDFQFAPATLTVHVGDTITWINNGPAPHTATARNGSFDTGLLKKGASGSHTFTQAGTFAYFCTVHPFMHGTVVVLANAASSTPSTHTTPSAPSGSAPPTTTPATTPSSTPAQPAGPSLPNTGIDTGATAAIGLVLLALGAILRRERRVRRTRG